VRHRAATLALLATVGLTAGKLGVAALSGSVGLLSEGVHSFLDVVSASLSYFTVREAIKPADADHPFGHGKIETLSSLFESLMLVAAAGLIVYEGVEHLSHPAPLQHQGWAMGVMVVSIAASYWVYRHNLSASHETESSALKVNALHFLSDVVASIGVLVGLVALKLTGWLVIDPIIAFAVAAYILLISVRQVKEALSELSDQQLPESEIEEIRRIISTFEGRTIEAHDLRTRRSGAFRHIDFHLVVCGHMSVNESHAVCDEIELKICERFPAASVNIHVEPCETERTGCATDCAVLAGKGAGRA
jgi:cation diffusion facilitator family transporter